MLRSLKIPPQVDGRTTLNNTISFTFNHIARRRLPNDLGNFRSARWMTCDGERMFHVKLRNTAIEVMKLQFILRGSSCISVLSVILSVEFQIFIAYYKI
jgi:hypothetical protein